MTQIRQAVGLGPPQWELDLKTLMEQPWGRRFVWRQLSEAGVFRNPYAGQREATDFRCGEMNVGQRLLGDVTRVCPALYVKMVVEATNAAKDEKN